MTEIRGSISCIMTDLTVAIKEVREALEKEVGKELAKELIADVIRISNMTDAEIAEEFIDTLKKSAEIISGGATESSSDKEEL